MRPLLSLLAALALAPAACAESPRERFDYYVLSLSWSPQYCAETRRTDEPQCARPYAFVAHGLWPQNERGYPKNCIQGERVSERTIERMLPIMPSRSLVIHEWRAHGTCSGMAADDYFATVDKAYRTIDIPERYRLIGNYLSVDTAQLRRDFIASNPGLTPRGMALQCAGRYLQEVRVCLDRKLAPRACGDDLRDRCGSNVILRPLR